MDDLQIIQRESTSMLDKAKGLTVLCDEDYTVAGEFIMGCKALQKKIEEYHNPIVAQWHDGHKASIQRRDQDLDPVKQAIRIASASALTYKQEQERLAREEAQRIERERIKREEEERLKLAAELEAQGKTEQAAEVVAQPIATPRPTKIESPVPKVQGLSTRGKWVAEIVNPDLVGRKHCKPDQSLINITVQHKMYFLKNPTPEQLQAIEDEVGGIKIRWDEQFAGRVRV